MLATSTKESSVERIKPSSGEVVKPSSSKDIEAFKRPLDPGSGGVSKKRKVLSEDQFAEILDRIIQRECFPDLEKLKAQNAYLDAVANNDIQMMRELHTKYGIGRNTPSLRHSTDTPSSTFETPSSAGLSLLRKDNGDGTTPAGNDTQETHSNPPAPDVSDTESVVSSVTKSSKGKKPHEMGLNEFLNTYTSEDDQSFQDIIDEGIRRHKIKNSWLYKDEEEQNKQLQPSIMLPSAEDQQALEYQRPNCVDTWKYKNRNPVMYIPDGVAYTKEELAELAKKRIEVQFKNTRFTATPFKTEKKHEGSSSSSGGSTNSASKPLNLIRGLSEGKFGVDGKEISSTETPSVNGFKYVRTPSPTPGAEETPFLTWGEIEGTPFRLDAGDTPLPSAPGTPYRMIPTSQREKVALELAEKVSSRHRDKKQKTIEVAKSYLASPSPRPKTSTERMNSMSPAAQRFARSLLKKEPGTPRTPRV